MSVQKPPDLAGGFVLRKQALVTILRQSMVSPSSISLLTLHALAFALQQGCFCIHYAHYQSDLTNYCLSQIQPKIMSVLLFLFLCLYHS